MSVIDSSCGSIPWLCLRLCPWIDSSAVSVALQLACPAVEKFSRASSAGPPTGLATKFRKSDRVGRRGLSEPREEFHGCSLMYGLKSGSCRFWQRTDLPSGSNMLRAEIQRALRRAPRQLRRLRLGLQTRRGSNHSTAHVGESNSRSNFFPIRRATACVPSRWKVLSGEFRRPPDWTCK